MSKRSVVDRGRGSKRRKRPPIWAWLCNPQVLKAVIAGARLADTLVRLVKSWIG